jgi:fructuronate reductase
VVQDPLAAETARLLAGADTDEAKVNALLSLSAVFSPTLVADPRFRSAVTAAYVGLRRDGAVKTAERFLIR